MSFIFDCIVDVLGVGFEVVLTPYLWKEVLNVLKEEQQKHRPSSELSADNFVINELIKEYLEWNHYNQTSDVLSLESGQPKQKISRVELENTINVQCGENSAKIPLLYSLMY